MVKLGLQSVIHHLLFNLFPVSPDRMISWSSQIKCIFGSFSLSNFFFIWLSLEFFWLKIVLISLIDSLSDLKRSFIKVTEEPIFAIFSIEFNWKCLVLRLHLEYNIYVIKELSIYILVNLSSINLIVINIIDTQQYILYKKDIM